MRAGEDKRTGVGLRKMRGNRISVEKIMENHWLAILLAITLLSGCASYDGRGLVPGASTVSEVEALMGVPAARLASPGGSSVLYYPRGPAGRESYAVIVGADGKMQAIEQRLTEANIAKLVAGSATAAQVRELLGPPPTIAQMPRLHREVWEYRMMSSRPMPETVLYVQLSSDGIVREILMLTDPEADPDSPDSWN